MPRRPAPTTPDSRPPRRPLLDLRRPGPSTPAADFDPAGDLTLATTAPTSDRRPGADWRPAVRLTRPPSPTAGSLRRALRDPCDPSDRPGRHHPSPFCETIAAEAGPTTGTFGPLRTGRGDRSGPTSAIEPEDDSTPRATTATARHPGPDRLTATHGNHSPATRQPTLSAPATDPADQGRPAGTHDLDPRPQRTRPALTPGEPGAHTPTDQPPPTVDDRSLSLRLA